MVGPPPRLEGFVYYPMLEVGFGIFLMVVSFVPSIFNFRINGLHQKFYLEWLFCITFFFFFFWMGKALTFQSFEAKVKDGKLVIRQNLREPPVFLETDIRDIQNVRSGSEKDEAGNESFTLLIAVREKENEVYRSVNSGEIKKIIESLEILRKSV